MKTYKDFNKKFIGESDIASLTLRSETSCAALNFGMDAAYMAYIVTEEAEIGSHYKLIFEGKSWLKIFDDTELTFFARADKINIYRAGELGCIIQLIGNAKIEPTISITELTEKIHSLTNN